MNTSHANSPEDRIRVGFLVIGRKRPGFDPEWAGQMERQACAALGEIHLDIFRPQTRAVDDGSLRRAMDEIQRAQCETVIVLQPTMGDGRLAPVLAGRHPDPLVFWATPERPDGCKVSSCSLVGAHAFASIFRQLGRPFEIAYGHPDDENTRRQLTRAVRVCRASAALRRSKVGLVESHAPGFLNMHAEPAALYRQLGVVLHHAGMEEFITLVEGQEARAVEEDIDHVTAMNLPVEEGLSRDDLAVNSRYYLAMRALMAEENLDAMAVRCWPELPNRLGHWPYLAMARLASEGRVVALEGDVDGAVSCLIGRLLGAAYAYVSDWLDHDDAGLTLWHPGHAPLEICQPGSARLGRHFNNGLPLVVNATLTPGSPITIFRLWRCDDRYAITAANAQTAPPRRELLGAHARAVLDGRNVHDWFESLCHEGMPHHVIVLPGHRADELKRFARQMRVRWVA